VPQSIPTHAAKAVIRNAQGEILFLQRSAAGNWDLPGGLVEEGEDDVLALGREISEELSVECLVGKELGTWSFYRPLDGATVEVTNYEVSLSDSEIKLSDEHTDFQYVPKDQLGKLPVKDASLWNAIEAQ
jgi:8-oxo-dGTP diphosphatase